MCFWRSGWSAASRWPGCCVGTNPRSCGISPGHDTDRTTANEPGPRGAEVEYEYDKFTNMVTVADGDFQVVACVIPKPGGGSAFERYCIQATEASAWR
ncbi:hypothetical protein Shyhy02_24900 [Streptomyces hygroscopicus subsp. hygroscopicus]|nr:hypothetical protein Shyhy02_24900 [Streptomyces hygroscopicus subsp. hygroscopicus]